MQALGLSNPNINERTHTAAVLSGAMCCRSPPRAYLPMRRSRPACWKSFLLIAGRAARVGRRAGRAPGELIGGAPTPTPAFEPAASTRAPGRPTALSVAAPSEQEQTKSVKKEDIGGGGGGGADCLHISIMPLPRSVLFAVPYITIWLSAKAGAARAASGAAAIAFAMSRRESEAGSLNADGEDDHHADEEEAGTFEAGFILRARFTGIRRVSMIVYHIMRPFKRVGRPMCYFHAWRGGWASRRPTSVRSEGRRGARAAGLVR